MSIQLKVHFWRFTLRRRWILMRMIFCGNGVARAKILKKSGVFGAMGDNCWYEPHKLPSEPQLVFMGNNVNIAADVAILNHDIMAAMINRMTVCRNAIFGWGGKPSGTMCSSVGARLFCMM